MCYQVPLYWLPEYTSGYPDMNLKPLSRARAAYVLCSRKPFQAQAMRTFSRRLQHASAIASSIIFLSACSGGSSGVSTNASGEDSLIIGGTAGGDASSVNDDQLRRTAASQAGAGLGINLNSLSRLNDDAMTNADGDGGIGGLMNSTDTDAIDSLDTDNNNFLNNSLGIDDPGARTTREGNIITIDPDDQSICGDEIPLASGLNDEQSQCQQLVSDLTVQVDARSEDSGIITYLFQNSPVLLIGYSSMGASYEINLGGLQLVTQRAEELNGTVSTNMTIISGVVRLTSSVLNDQPGQEVGELSLQVTETINFGSTGSEEGITLQPSTVFSVRFDEALGDVSMALNWGALQLITSSGSASSDGQISSSTSVLNLGGLSAELSFNENQPALKITNIGIGDVPLTLTIDSIESVNLTLAKFGITVDDETGSITLDGALNASLMLNNIAQLFEDQAPEFTASATISAPASTVLIPQDNGSTLVSSGGPLTATIIGGDATSNGQTEVSINAGECVSSGDDTTSPELATLGIAAVPCD